MGKKATAATLFALAVTACGTPVARHQAHTPTTDLAARCARNVSYWAAEAVSGKPDAGLDYQEMGLVDSEYDILRDVLATHRAHRPQNRSLSADETAYATPRCHAHFGTRTSPPPRTGHTWPSG